MKNTKKLSIFAAIILFFTFSLTGCQNNQEKAKQQNQSKQSTVKRVACIHRFNLVLQ